MDVRNILNLHRNLKINVNLSSYLVALVHNKEKVFPLLKSRGFSDTPEMVAGEMYPVLKWTFTAQLSQQGLFMRSCWTPRRATKFCLHSEATTST